MDDVDRELLALEQRIATYRLPRHPSTMLILLDAMHDIERLLQADTIRSRRTNAALAVARRALATIEGEAKS